MALTYFTTSDQAFEYTAAEFGGTVGFHLEVWMLATAGTVYARLYDDTAASEVAHSVVSTASGSYVRNLSSGGVLIDGHVYRFQLGADTGHAGTVKGIPRWLVY